MITTRSLHARPRHPLASALLATVGPVRGLRVLDIGCGEGHLARALAEQGARVTGYDPFIAETPLTVHGAGSYRLANAPADALPEPEHEADLVLFVFSLHHVPGAKLERALAEARRVLRPRAVSMWRSRWRRARINTSSNFSTMRRRCAKAPPMHSRVLPGRSSRPMRSRPMPRSVAYPDFDLFAARMIANMRFNGYSEEAVLAPAVRRRFEETHAAHGGRFDQPVRIDCFGPAV